MKDYFWQNSLRKLRVRVMLGECPAIILLFNLGGGGEIVIIDNKHKFKMQH